MDDDVQPPRPEQRPAATEGADRYASPGPASASKRAKTLAVAAKVSDPAKGARNGASQAGDIVREDVERARGGHNSAVEDAGADPRAGATLPAHEAPDAPR